MRIMVAMLAGVLLAGAASAAQFQNGSFELGMIPASSKSLGIGDGSITGWTVFNATDPAGNVEWQKNGSYPGVYATDGVYSVDLSGNPDNNGSGLRQMFDTLNGHTYSLTFDVGLNTNYTSAGGSAVSALVNGLLVGTLANADTSQTQTWTTGTYSFLATSGSTTLDLVKAAGGNYAGLDNVRIADLTPNAPVLPGTVPEPASWAMLVAGFGLLGAAMRRRRAGDLSFIA